VHLRANMHEENVISCTAAENKMHRPTSWSIRIIHRDPKKAPPQICINFFKNTELYLVII